MFSHIKIGRQKWKKKDLAIDDGLGGIKVIDGIYYYEWDAAMRVAAQVKGYHIPTHEEFMKAIKLCKCEYEPCEQIWNFSYTKIDSFKKKFGFIPGAGYEFGHSAYTISGIKVDTGFISKDWARYWCSDLAKDTETIISRYHHCVTITNVDNDIWIGRDVDSMCYRVRLIKDTDVDETCEIIHLMEPNERKKPIVMFDREGMHTDSLVIYYGAIILSLMMVYGMFVGFASFYEWLHTL